MAAHPLTPCLSPSPYNSYLMMPTPLPYAGTPSPWPQPPSPPAPQASATPGPASRRRATAPPVAQAACLLLWPKWWTWTATCPTRRLSRTTWCWSWPCSSPAHTYASCAWMETRLWTQVCVWADVSWKVHCLKILLTGINNKRPLIPKSMPPAGDEHAKLKT